MDPPNMQQQPEASPFLTPSRNSGVFTSHPNASKTDTATGAPSLGGEEARRSQVSMIGLGTAPQGPSSNWLQNEVKHQKRNRVLVSPLSSTLSWSSTMSPSYPPAHSQPSPRLPFWGTLAPPSSGRFKGVSKPVLTPFLVHLVVSRNRRHYRCRRHPWRRLGHPAQQ
jgi:hypothetical protein